MVDASERATGGYGAGIRGLHWLLFILIATQFTLAWLMGLLGDHSAGHKLAMNSHMSFGVLILLAAVMLIGTRLSSHRPSNAFLPDWQQRLSWIVHGLLYVLLLAQPLIGVIMDMSAGFGIPIFGLFTIPPLIPEKSAPSWIGAAHYYVGWTFFWLLALHIVAALYHALFRRDGVFTRMLRG